MLLVRDLRSLATGCILNQSLDGDVLMFYSSMKVLKDPLSFKLVQRASTRRRSNVTQGQHASYLLPLDLLVLLQEEKIGFATNSINPGWKSGSESNSFAI